MTNTQENRLITRIKLMNIAAMSRTISQDLEQFNKTTGVYMNSYMSFDAAWIVSSGTMTTASLKATTQRRAFSMPYFMIKLKKIMS